MDIIIGTHRLLSRDVQFKNLGLVVIDEEQRFGVEQKERLKQMRVCVSDIGRGKNDLSKDIDISHI